MDVNLPHEQDPWDPTPTYGDIIRPTYPERYTDVQYRIHDLHTLGSVATIDKKLFEYSYINEGIEIIQCTFQQGTWDSSGGFMGIGAKYKANYTGNKLRIDEQNITGEQLQTKHPRQFNNLIQRIQVIRAGNIIDSFLGSIQSNATSSSNKDLNSSYGYQVRCVKE